jgi:hypothetical protein
LEGKREHLVEMGETSDNLIKKAKKMNGKEEKGQKKGEHLVEVGETSQPRRQFLPVQKNV